MFQISTISNYWLCILYISCLNYERISFLVLFGENFLWEYLHIKLHSVPCLDKGLLCRIIYLITTDYLPNNFQGIAWWLFIFELNCTLTVKALQFLTLLSFHCRYNFPYCLYFCCIFHKCVKYFSQCFFQWTLHQWRWI